ncbi:MAG TPA: Gfo/Idh/MocA family oxidoreductase [Thermomicrobiales bacterium]|nr:Gfo/Idh/MocA family oxidoreductase [Thermomicrobiales bacterium]
MGDRAPVRVGLVGCGFISRTYLENAARLPILDVVACADLVPKRAAALAAEFGIPRSCSVDELVADPEVEVVLNLTIPVAHAEIALAAVEAGKSVYNEKPLTIELADGRRLIELAAAKGVRVGCAPDTFLGAGLQTCRKLIDEGVIGEPVAANASMLCHGHEHWHPDPAFYYQPGGGPLFDMGPYYLTALVSLLGPVRRVAGSARASFAQRTITSRQRAGQIIDVQVPTHTTAILDFAAGPIATFVTSFDVWARESRIEIYGSEGTLAVPDPNKFGGPVRIGRPGATEWEDVSVSHGYADNSRGLGLADMAEGLRNGRPHRASGELALHVLETMHAVHDASREGRHVELTSCVDRPAPLPG